MSSICDYKVYKHTCPNGKVYIGITQQDAQKRWKSNGAGYKNNEHFYRAIQKYGWQNITHQILFDHLTKEEAEQKEVELIAMYKSNRYEFGYNVANGGNAIGYIADETRQKISDTLKGHEVSQETRRKISNSLKGKHLSDETKKKLSDVRKGKSPNKGYKWSEEQKAKLREIRKSINQGKPVLQILNGNIVGEYRSLREASEVTGADYRCISRVCHGARKTTNGFEWKFNEI